MPCVRAACVSVGPGRAGGDAVGGGGGGQVDAGGGRTDSATVEVTLPQFYELLQEMEKAKAAVDYLAA